LITKTLLGAVGKQLLKDVLKNGKYEKVVAIGRRPVELEESVPQDKLVMMGR
jgi:oxidoreductase